MSFDFKRAQAQAKDQMDNKALFCMILGPSGSGKSSIIGTMPGRTLLVYGSGESHGPKAAAGRGGNITPVCMDSDGGKELTPDESCARLHEILSDVEGIKKNFDTVALDGIPEIEATILKSKKFEAAITSDKGKINSYQKSPAMSGLLRDIVMLLKALHKNKINVLTTCRTSVQAVGDDGAVVECTPTLSTFGVVDEVISKFDDIIMVGPVKIGGKSGYAIQFGGHVSRVSKDLEGRVKKILGFSPRVTGVTVADEFMKASLKDLAELKNPKVEEKK